jgi:hypothetical protein
LENAGVIHLSYFRNRMDWTGTGVRELEAEGYCQYQISVSISSEKKKLKCCCLLSTLRTYFSFVIQVLLPIVESIKNFRSAETHEVSE